jgi:hypothetical protein
VDNLRRWGRRRRPKWLERNRVPKHIASMRGSEVECPWCGAWYRRIEVTSMKDEPGGYECLLCDQPLESFSGETYVAYRLTVQPMKTFKYDPETPRAP